ncbi:MAG: nitroreductase family protein [Bacteroidales bacterium]|nr:nitroreductase family protein [Bacteroidales bacterium]
MKKTTILLAVAALMMGACCHKQEASTGSTAEAVVNNIMQRKSVRQYTGAPIAQDTLATILRAAMAAPSARDWRPWSFVVIDDKSQLESIFGDNMNMRMFRQAGAIVVVCADTVHVSPTRENPDGPAVPQVNSMWRDDMGAVCENLLLAVEAYGLGACWTACYPFADRMAPVREALGLPPTVVPYAVVPIGIPTGDSQPKDKWDETRIHHNRW